MHLQAAYHHPRYRQQHHRNPERANTPILSSDHYWWFQSPKLKHGTVHDHPNSSEFLYYNLLVDVGLIELVNKPTRYRINTIASRDIRVCAKLSNSIFRTGTPQMHSLKGNQTNWLHSSWQWSKPNWLAVLSPQFRPQWAMELPDWCYQLTQIKKFYDNGCQNC